MADKIDSNAVQFSVSEETSLGTLALPATWRTREPNSFDGIGLEPTVVARRPFNPSRQRKKGTIVDFDASGGFNEDLTQNNMQRLLQGFFFAAIRQQPTNLPINGTQYLATTVGNTTGIYSGAAGFGSTAGFIATHIVKASGYTNAANNGLFVVSAVASGTVTTNNTASVTEGAAPAAAKLEAVGVEFASGDCTMTASASTVTLGLTSASFTNYRLIPGQWVFIGGDATANKYATVSPGYARIKSVAAKSLVLDKTTFTPLTDTGSGKTIRMYFGDVLMNEDSPSLIVRKSYQFERTLGSDGVGTQGQYLVGSVANEVTWNSPLSDKVTLDMSYVAMNTEYKTGTEGIKSTTGGATLIPELGESAFNTSSNLFRLRMAILDPATLNPTPYFARVTEWTATINNNVSGAKAQGTAGAFDMTVGMFEVDAEMTAYFSSVGAMNAIKLNSDVTFDAIYSKDNAAVIMDMPLISLSGGALEVQQDQPITLPLNSGAAESSFGHTLMLTWLNYVPTAGVA